jgi:hypothetical protein
MLDGFWCSFHTVGLFLLGGEWRDQLVILTPFNFLLLAGLFFIPSERPTVKWVYYLTHSARGFYHRTDWDKHRISFWCI